MEKLCFCSAAYGGWGIVRAGTLVPESHMLFVCPYSCGRHNSIGAIQHGYKDKISYLYIDERDMAMGNIAEDLLAAAGTVLDSLAIRPKAMLIYFSCVLYMSGFDWDSAVEELRLTYRDVLFQACMMNPIAADTRRPPALTMQRSLTRLWDTRGGRDDAVNIIGGYVAIDGRSELFDVAGSCGVSGLRQWGLAETFEAYRRMGKSRYNLVLRPEGLLAAKELVHIMDYRFVPVSYDIEQIREQYAQIFEMLGKSCDLGKYEASALESIKKALAVVGARKIAVGSSAVCRPFSLARALVRYGFCVSDVFYESCPPFEKDAFDELRAKHPGISLRELGAPEDVKSVGSLGAADIAVGYSAGYHSGAPMVADLMTDEGMFGYRAVERLMGLLVDCVKSPKALEAMIESYGLII